MKQLRLSITFFLVVSTLFLWLEERSIGGATRANLASSDALLLVFSLPILVLFPFWGRQPVWLPLLLWVGGLILLKGVRIQQLALDVTALQMHIAELAVVGLLVFLAHRINRLLHEFEEVVQDIVLNEHDLPRHATNSATAREQIKREFLRARAGERPLSLFLVEPKQKDLAITFSRMLTEIQQAMVKRYTFLRISKVIHPKLRLTDLILQDQEKRIILLCPEVNARQAASLVQQIGGALQEQLDLGAVITAATFPEDSYTFDGLMAKAEQQLAATTPNHLNGGRDGEASQNGSSPKNIAHNCLQLAADVSVVSER